MSFRDNSKARDFAVKFLYQSEAEKIHHFSDNHFENFATHLIPQNEVKVLAREYCQSVLNNVAQLDEHIKQASPNWSLERLASTDRAILRLAIYELLESDTPIKVILNEAIKLAKQYGTENSGKFVNGVLDTVAKRIRTVKS